MPLLVISYWLLVISKKNKELTNKSPITNHQPGFTLIELLIAISIISILASIGFVSYNQTQILGRDSRRKQDLKAIQTALELYKYDPSNSNKLYPTTVGFVNSTGASPWISGLDSNFISTSPKDPINTCPSSTSDPRSATPCYAYSYFSGNWNNLDQPSNNGYILSARLENLSDPEVGKQIRAGASHSAAATWPETPVSYLYVVTNP